MEDDTDLTLRDKLAAAALPSLIQRFNDKVDSKWLLDGEITEEFDRDFECIARMAYKIADAMRKARIQAFK